jgi:hypothetical protein
MNVRKGSIHVASLVAVPLRSSEDVARRRVLQARATLVRPGRYGAVAGVGDCIDSGESRSEVVFQLVP